MGIEEVAGALLKVIPIGNGITSDFAGLEKRITEIVKQHAVAATVAAAGTAWLPGIGATIATAASAGVVWTMYLRINKELQLSLSEGLIKGVAAGIGTNIGVYAGSWLLGTALSFIPVIGSISAEVVVCGMAYALTIASGYVYLSILTDIFKAGKNPSSLNKEDFQKYAKNVMDTNDMKSVINDAKKEYEESKKK